MGGDNMCMSLEKKILVYIFGQTTLFIYSLKEKTLFIYYVIISVFD